MKIVRFLSISILLSVFFSCSHGFLKDPRLYNPKRVTVQTVAPEPELQLTGGVDPFDAEAWYNNPDSNGDEDNKDLVVGFNASEFDQIQIAGWFSDENVPTYTMTKGDVWKEGDATKREYVHSNAPSTEGQGWSITGVTYYQYRGINPNYEATGNYNTSLQTTKEGKPKLNRFYFYRFTGKGGGVQWLDNYLIAVDTYSKLIFAFSEPVEFSSMGAPTKWDPTDNEAFYGTTYQFYMYDPVGYVLKKDDGSYEIQLYQWFQDSLASGNYKANINTAYSEIAKKDKNEPGKSPFNSHDVNFFEENMKMLDKTKFLRREVTSEGRNGVVLYRYDFNSEGTQITRTAESWNDLPTDTPLDTVIYTIGNGESATEGKITKDGVEGTLKLEDESRALILTIGDETEVIGLIDYGPDFLERVKGAQYKSEDGKTSYKFSEDGTTLIFKADGKTYNYKFEKSFGTNRTEAVFGSNDASAYYAGFRLLSRDGKKDGRIQCTKRSAFWAETVDWSIGYAANRVEKLKEDFKSSVAGKTFSLREENHDGYTKTLWSWTFDDTGDTATFVTTIWNQKTPQKDTAVTVENGNTSTTGRIGSKEASLHFNEESGIWTLKVDNKDYEFIYNDPTPSFLNRVKGTTYEGSGRTFVFSEDGKTITCTNGTYENDTYTYVEQDANDRAVYYRHNRPWYEVGLQHWGLRLANDDNTLYWSGTPWASPSTTPTANVSSKPAWKKPVLGNNFHETVAGRGWQIRKDNTDYEGLEDGLELLTWEFSSDGKTATLYEAIWREKRDDDEERADDVMTIDITSTGEKSGIGTGGYTFTLSDDLMTLTVTGGSDSGRTYKFGYDDPGPAWLLRVKDNPIFTGESQFEFRDGGRTLIYDGIECYYDDRVTKKHGLGRDSAVYSFPENWGLFDVWYFYRLSLTNEDTEIAGTVRDSEGGGLWDTAKYTATRQGD